MMQSNDTKSRVWRILGVLGLFCAFCLADSPMMFHHMVAGIHPGVGVSWAQSRRPKGINPARMMPGGHFGSLWIRLPNGRRKMLDMRSLKVRVTIQGRMARTEVEQVFVNKTFRQAEGDYTFRLPYGAAIARLAMDINGKMMEGEIVERSKARAIYSSIVRKMRDPALLEWQGGNRFRTQIFPIPARGTKRVILAYDHVLESDQGTSTYVYHLPRNSKNLGKFDFQLKALSAKKVGVLPYDAMVQKQAKGFHVKLANKRFKPRGDITVKVTYPKGKGVLHAGKVAGKQYGVLVLPLQLKGNFAPWKKRVLVVDTSAGMRGKAFRKAKALAKTLLEGLGEGSSFGLVVGDVEARVFRKGVQPLSQRAAALAFLNKQEVGGATHLQKLLTSAIKLAGDKADIIYIGDGIASLGESDADLLAKAYKKAIGNKSIRLSSIAVGASPDTSLLRKLARLTGGRSIQLLAGKHAETVATSFQKLLSQPQLTNITYKIDGMKGIIRAQQGNIATGESLLLAGQMTKPAIRVTVDGKINGKTPFRIKGVYEPATTAAGLIAPAFWAKWTIASLEQAGVERPRIVKMSKTFGVMSRYTSFLVLENERAYKKYQVARRRRHQGRRNLFEAGVGRIGRAKKGKAGAKEIRRWMREEKAAPTQAPADGFGSGSRGGAAGGGAPSGGALDDAAPSRLAYRGARTRSKGRARRTRRPRPSFAARPQAEPSPSPTLAPAPAKKNTVVVRRPVTTTPAPPKGDQALRQARRVVKNKPMSWYARLRLHNLLVSRKKYHEAYKALLTWRTYSPDNLELIRKQLGLLTFVGKKDQSRRILSELVEFAPHSFKKRSQYAGELERLGNVTSACRQLAQAVRLNPSKRDTFKKMMNLYRSRRSQSEFKGIIRSCITRGVSRLPVVRDISMVLFWDDPKADIDLYVKEPNGEVVSFRKRESSQGGTLYYDIMNGFGPEVYVLGTGKKGTYKISLVYYGGPASVVPATLVVMRHAGSPRETRKTYRVKLLKKQGRKKIFVLNLKVD